MHSSTVLRVVLLSETGELKEYESFKNTFSKVVSTNLVYEFPSVEPNNLKI